MYNLNAYGIKTIRDIVNTDVNYLVQIPGMGPKTAAKIIALAHEYFEKRAQKELETSER